MALSSRLTWAFYLLLIIVLLWIRFLEKYVSIWGALFLWLALLPICLKYGMAKLIMFPVRKFIKAIKAKAFNRDLEST